MGVVGGAMGQRGVAKHVSGGDFGFIQTDMYEGARRKVSLTTVNECLCLHAEENALLEAGRERIGEDSVIYCNTYVFFSRHNRMHPNKRISMLTSRCPCLRCSVKIVQCGVREVVYNQSYSMDEASAMVLKEAGVVLRQLHMPP
jgi:dCMP deaminase